MTRQQTPAQVLADALIRVNAAHGLEPRRARRKIARAWAKHEWRERAALFAAFCGLLALTSVLGLTQAAYGQGSRKDDVVYNALGQPLAGATVRVCTSPATGEPCSPLANIYSDLAMTQALANPITADGLGNYFFYAAPGRYMIEISGPTITTKQIPNVILPNDPSAPTFTSITTTSGINAFSLSLSGNLTVTGAAAVTGTLTAGGAPVPTTAQANSWTAPQSFAGTPEYTVLCTHNLSADTTAFWAAVAAYNAAGHETGPVAVRVAAPYVGCWINGGSGTLDYPFAGGDIEFYADVEWNTRGLYLTTTSMSQGNTAWTLHGVQGMAGASAAKHPPGTAPQFSVDGNFPAVEVDGTTNYVGSGKIDNFVIQGGSGTTLCTQSSVYIHGTGTVLHETLSNLTIAQSGTYPLCIDGGPTGGNSDYDITLNTLTLTSTTPNGTAGGGLMYIRGVSWVKAIGSWTLTAGFGVNTLGSGSGQFPIHLEDTPNFDASLANLSFEEAGGYFINPSGGTTWSSSQTYCAAGSSCAGGTRVVYNGVRYDSTINGNVNNTPGTNGDWVGSYGALVEFGGSISFIASFGNIGSADSTASNYLVQNNGTANVVVSFGPNLVSSDSIGGLSAYGYGIDEQLGCGSAPSYTVIGSSPLQPVNFPYCAGLGMQQVDDTRRAGGVVTPRHPNVSSYWTGETVGGLISAVGVTDEYGGTQAFTLHGNGTLDIYHIGSIFAGQIYEVVVAVRPHTSLQGQNPLYIACSPCTSITSQSFGNQFSLGSADANGWYWEKAIAIATGSGNGDIYLNVTTGNDIDFAHMTVVPIPSGYESISEALKETIALIPYPPSCGADVPCTINGPVVSGAFSTQTSAYTLKVSDSWVNVTGTTTVTVPHAIVGQQWNVFNSGSGTVTLQADSGSINGTSSITLAANTGKSVTCDGTNCFAH